MVQVMDLLDRYELQIANLADETLEGMRHEYPSYFVVQNPVDVTGSGTAHDYEVGINALLADLNVDIVMPWFVFQDPALGEEIVEILKDLSGKYGKPIVCGAMGGNYTQRMSSRIEAMGLPVFHSVQEWVAAGAGLCRGARQRS